MDEGHPNRVVYNWALLRVLCGGVFGVWVFWVVGSVGFVGRQRTFG